VLANGGREREEGDGWSLEEEEDKVEFVLLKWIHSHHVVEPRRQMQFGVFIHLSLSQTKK